MQLLLFNASNGLIQGVFYALMALGLALILGLNSAVNFAHGGFLLVGGYLAFTLTPSLGLWGALLVRALCAAILGLTTDRLLMLPLYRRRDPIYSLLVTFGVARVMEDAVRTLWGAEGLPFTIPGWLNSPISQF